MVNWKSTHEKNRKPFCMINLVFSMLNINGSAVMPL